MRVYLSKKQIVEGGKTYHPGFYPSDRVPEELAQEWLDAGIACPATADNVAERPYPEWPEPKPEPKPEPVLEAETEDDAPPVETDSGLLLDDELMEDEDNG